MFRIGFDGFPEKRFRLLKTLCHRDAETAPRDRDLHQPFHDRLMHAYWAEATDIGEPDALRALVSAGGDVGASIQALRIVRGHSVQPRALYDWFGTSMT